jgi:hypothetical protein
VRLVKKAKAESKKPLAAAKPEGAPKAARYQWIFYETHSQRRFQANDNRKIQIKRILKPLPPVLNSACARYFWPANRRKQARCYQ